MDEKMIRKIEGHLRGTFANARINRIDGHQVGPFWLAVRIHRPSHEQLGADELGILPGGDNGPDDTGEDHRTACLATTGC